MTPEIESFKLFVSRTYNINMEEFYLICNGRKLTNVEQISNHPIYIIPRVLGGKGGFGSMLRAIGAQIEKTTNREACRDLSGRRLRDINEERRLKTWLSQKEEKKKENDERRRSKLKRMCQEPKIEFEDEDYEHQRVSLTENVSESLEQGLKAGPSGMSCKRSNDADDPLSKKKKLKGMLLEIDIDDLSSDASDSDISDDQKCSSDTKKNSAGSIKTEVSGDRIVLKTD